MSSSTIILNQVPVALYDECGNKILVSSDGGNLYLSVRDIAQEELLRDILNELKSLNIHLSSITELGDI